MALAVIAVVLAMAAIVAGLWLLEPSQGDSLAAGPELIVLDWPYDLPQSVLDDFGRAHGVTVRRIIYTAPGDAERILRSNPPYDVAVIEYSYVRPLAGEGKLAPIDLRAVTNFPYVDPSFRNLVFDPTNRYSVPASWTLVGIIASNGVFTGTDVSWNDLWDADLGGGKLAVWTGSSRHVIAATLKRLGYSVNSEDPAELAVVRAELLRLRPRTLVFDNWQYNDYVVPAVMGEIKATIADTAMFKAARDLALPVQFYFPREGTLIWGDSLVIPANSRNPALATAFIDTVLSAKVAAEIMDHKNMHSTNEAALQYTSPSLRYNPVLFPGLDTLRQAELVLPLTQAGQERWDALWADFVKGEE